MFLLSKYKKAFQILGFISAAFLFGFLIYHFFFRSISAPLETLPTGTSTPGSRLPQAGGSSGQAGVGEGGSGILETGGISEQKGDNIANGGLTKTQLLSSEESFGQKLAQDGSIEFYNKKDGRFYRLDSDGESQALSDKVFYDVQNVYWAPVGDKAILEYPDGANILYNFKTEKQVTLPSHWQDYDFAPTGDQVVMKSMGTDASNNWLAIANDDGTGSKAIEPLGENGDQVFPSWSPNKQSVALYVESTGLNQQEVIFIGLNNENFTAMTIEGRGFKYLWSPRGDRLLYSIFSSASDLKPVLWAANAQSESIGSGRKNLQVETWADKCVYADAESVYCAVPDKIEEGAGLYPELGNSTPDKVYLVNTYTGLKKLIAIPEIPVSMHNLMLSENGRNLYYSDPAGKIYKIRLE
ncbi:MAG: hypothetical protein WC715_01675 [Patescibacteria group bacterium]|jgi:hypothetical protein